MEKQLEFEIFPSFSIHSKGVYVCSQCGTELFNGKAKYKHTSAWPAFTETVSDDVLRKEVQTEPQTSSSNPALKVISIIQCF